jgi:CDP-glucose 4,6-dehydratase
MRDKTESPHEAGYLKLDASKARSLLDWRPVLPLAVALDWLVSWFLAWKQGEDMQAFTLRQITNYESRLPTQAAACSG